MESILWKIGTYGSVLGSLCIGRKPDLPPFWSLISCRIICILSILSRKVWIGKRGCWMSTSDSYPEDVDVSLSCKTSTLSVRVPGCIISSRASSTEKNLLILLLACCGIEMRDSWFTYCAESVAVSYCTQNWELILRTDLIHIQYGPEYTSCLIKMYKCTRGVHMHIYAILGGTTRGRQ